MGTYRLGRVIDHVHIRVSDIAASRPSMPRHSEHSGWPPRGRRGLVRSRRAVRERRRRADEGTACRAAGRQSPGGRALPRGRRKQRRSGIPRPDPPVGAAHRRRVDLAGWRGRPARRTAERIRSGPTATRGRPRTPKGAVRPLSNLIRRRPTLPGGCPPSTIGAGGLNCSVRNGKRCFPAAMTAGSL